MTAYLQFGIAPNPCRTAKADQYDEATRRLLWEGRWRRVQTIKGRHYCKVYGELVRVTIE